MILKMEELERKQSEPGFWDNPEVSQKIVQEAGSYKNTLDEFDAMQGAYDDALVMMEMAEEEDDEDAILLYIKRKIGEEDIVQRLDKHCSTLRYFLEGWIAIGMVNKLQEYELTNNIFAYLDNPLASPLWKEALNAGYLSNAIRSGSYIYGKGNQRNVLKALTEIEQYAINEAFQYGRILHYGKLGAIGYRTYRQSSYPCEACDELTRHIWPLDVIVLPEHPRCVCGSRPVFADEI